MIESLYAWLVVDIAREHDPEILRQVALLLDHENGRLHRRLVELTEENARLKGQGATQLALELETLKEQLAARTRELFAPSSEKRPHEQGEPTPRPRTGHGPHPQPSLPLVEEKHELAPEQCTCSVCGGTLRPWLDQAEESEEVTVVERKLVLVKHRRMKYRCSCNANVVTAPAPAKLIPGGRYSADFAVEVAAGKFLDHLPLERQAAIFAREGLEVSSQTLYDQTEALARHLEPTYRALIERVLKSPVVLADDTYWPLLSNSGGTSRWWSWCLASGDTVVYRILPHRSKEAATAVLPGYSGVVMCDGYGVYQSLARAGPGVMLAHCWAHVRRKYTDCEPEWPELAGEAIARIGELFAVEREVPRLAVTADAADVAAALELRARLRQERSAPVVRELYEWALEHKPRVLPRSGIGKAIVYMLTLWPGLTRFLSDPRVPLDNNGAERALRGMVVGRKNHYGSHSKRGSEVAAVLYSLLETAKLAGAEPKGYLRAAVTAALRSPGAVTFPESMLS